MNAPPTSTTDIPTGKTVSAGDAPRASVNILPTELISLIFSFLDGPQPSSLMLYDEPTFNLTHSETADLKAISLVSKRWRETVFTQLFRHARFILSTFKLPVESFHEETQLFIDFVKRASLAHIMITFTLVIRSGESVYDRQMQHSWNRTAAFWDLLFEAIDPTELLIVAPTEVLGVLTSCNVSMEEAWVFDRPCQYLRLRRLPCSTIKAPKLAEAGCPSKDVKTSTASDVPPSTRSFETSHLFRIRPWYSLLLNEGSFIKAYSTYEFWLRRAPSILPDLVGAGDGEHDTRGPCISPTIREMSYIGIFPMASHFSSLTMHCPRLDRLYVQLVPRNEILNNPEKTAQVETEDLWMERNNCYRLLMTQLFSSPPIQNYRYLQVFESGDAADKDAWNMAVDYIKRVGNHWKVVADGVVIKEPGYIVSKTAEGSAVVQSTFQGALVKWAWNGTTSLPVPSYPLYH